MIFPFKYCSHQSRNVLSILSNVAVSYNPNIRFLKVIMDGFCEQAAGYSAALTIKSRNLRSMISMMSIRTDMAGTLLQSR